MKTPILTIFCAVLCSFSFGQNCHCDKDTLLDKYVSCDTIKFDNHSILHWNFNCDSSWLTFENPKVKTVIFSLGDSMVFMTGRLGYVNFVEYKNTFLAINKVASGCCFPLDFYLYDKSNGELKESLGRLIFYSKDPKTPFVIGITNSNYDKTDTKTANYKTLTIYNVDNGKKQLFNLPETELKKAIKIIEPLFLEELFDEPILKDNIIYLKYYIDKGVDNKERPSKTLTIDLNKYCN